MEQDERVAKLERNSSSKRRRRKKKEEERMEIVRLGHRKEISHPLLFAFKLFGCLIAVVTAMSQLRSACRLHTHSDCTWYY